MKTPAGSNRFPVRQGSTPSSASSRSGANPESPYPRSNPHTPEPPTPDSQTPQPPSVERLPRATVSISESLCQRAQTSYLAPFERSREHAPTDARASEQLLRELRSTVQEDGSPSDGLRRDHTRESQHPHQGNEVGFGSRFSALRRLSPTEIEIQRLASEQLLHELKAAIPDNESPSDELRVEEHLRQEEALLRSISSSSRFQSLSRSSVTEGPVPDVSEGDHDSNVGLQDPEDTVSEGSNDEHKDHQDNLDEVEDVMLSLTRDQEQQLEVARIDIACLEEELHEQEHALLDLQQQLEESQAREHELQGNDVDTVDDADQQSLARIQSLTEQLLEAKETIEQQTVQLAEANRKLTGFRDNTQSVGTQSELDRTRVDQEDHQQEVRDYITQLSTTVNSLSRQLCDLREKNGQPRDADTADSDEQIAHVNEEAEQEISDLSAHIGFLNGRVADITRQLHATQKTNRDLEQQLAQADKQPTVADQELTELQGRNAALEEIIEDMTSTREEQASEIAMLREELEAAQEEIAVLHLEDTVDENFNDSGFVDEGTPTEPDELPRTKRLRGSPPEVEVDRDGESGDNSDASISSLPRPKRFRSSPPEFDVDYDDGSGEDLDDLISPSSFIESEPSPLLPKLRRSGRTRKESQRLSSSVHEIESESEKYQDEEDAQFQRDLATVAPADPKGLVVVIDRGEAVRARQPAYKSRASKRKRKN